MHISFIFDIIAEMDQLEILYELGFHTHVCIIETQTILIELDLFQIIFLQPVVQNTLFALIY